MCSHVGRQGRLGLLLVVPLVLGAWAGAPGVARADNFDAALLEYTPDVLFYLRFDKKYKNVGVLPFRVEKGKKPASFIAGSLCANLPTRLENALIMCSNSNESKALGVIRGAGAVAARHKVGSWYSSSRQRRKLFKVDYPLAWGKKKVKPDAFLTGLVRNSGDRSRTTVLIQAFSAADPRRLVKVVEFKVSTDRSLLRELGYNFALSKRSLARARSTKARNRSAAVVVGSQEEGEADADGASPADTGGISVKILYDGVEQKIRPVSAEEPGKEYYVKPVPVGTKVTIVLAHNGKRKGRLGAVLKVNGRSTWKEQQGDSLSLVRWLFDAGDKQEIEGYYYGTKGDNLKRFRVVNAKEAQARVAELGERVGYIDLDVFGKGEPRRGDEKMVISTRSVRPRKLPLPPARTLAELQGRLLKSNGVKRSVVRRNGKQVGVLLPDDTLRSGGDIVEEKLSDPVHLGGITIKYYDPEKMEISK
jgi:hypothetical protein